MRLEEDFFRQGIGAEERNSTREGGQGPTGVCWKGDLRRQEWVVSDRKQAEVE